MIIEVPIALVNWQLYTPLSSLLIVVSVRIRALLAGATVILESELSKATPSRKYTMPVGAGTDSTVHTRLNVLPTFIDCEEASEVEIMGTTGERKKHTKQPKINYTEV